VPPSLLIKPAWWAWLVCAWVCRRSISSPGSSPKWKPAFAQAIEYCRDLGAEIKPVHLPHTAEALAVYYLIAPAEASANLARYDGVRYGLRERPIRAGNILQLAPARASAPRSSGALCCGTYALSAGYYDAYYGQAQKVRTLIKDDFEQAFQAVDVIAAPVAPSTAFKLGEHGDDPLAMYLERRFHPAG